MSAFILTNRNVNELETTVFTAEGGDAVALFTDYKHAQQYLDDANWNESMTVAELDSIRFLEWLLHCYRSGVRSMAIDPRRSEQESGMRITTLEIEAQLEHAGSHIVQIARPDF